MKTYQEIKTKHQFLTKAVHDARVHFVFEGNNQSELAELEQRLQVCSKLLEEALMQPLFKNTY